ncbi:Ni/Fe-hydrogenase, b-type cytochrome subunit [Shewanella yunxiaonensis]|uniref:Ni/Fe-hydrogenase, b-type cytochrome subunit n=1 Tax=Shewanella yunxiaonensis TaxID=2829809 RepID=A0ABX7YX93_9GAMM|nr:MULTISPECIES: Ni/Fe-hydrogenase, b-type cytochrome subunit [Shewanella]MDF0534380.1 Ni/Fe-hydrogenase, b-type cytochrome subunit [Shewanella sp. A32]QUN07428.1 Ni/Fe-hydrogenase, b-type cytochrome subunit [Shewanella yunxiaonensis]
MTTTNVAYKQEKIFSAAIRVFHWLRALSIVALVATGFYIAWPYVIGADSTDVLVQGWIRFGHLIFGFTLCAITGSRAYLFFFSKSDIERRSFKDVMSPKSWLAQIKSYLWMGHLDKAGVYGPLQFMTYFAVSVLAAFMCITGLVLYANVYHQGLGGALWSTASWITEAMGGLAMVRIWHHDITWCFIIFLVIHIYMAVWYGIRFKHNAVDAIVSGYDYHPEKN